MKTVLIADDSRFMRNWLKKLLSEKNYFVIAEAENGVQAIEKYKLFLPDILIMDITMPLLNGIEALKEMIKFDSNAKVVMCSSLGQQQIIIEATKIGAKDFIVKPYFDNLIHILDKICHCSIR
jgi:two-component system chemotaxis response regulator CheY